MREKTTRKHTLRKSAISFLLIFLMALGLIQGNFVTYAASNDEESAERLEGTETINSTEATESTEIVESAESAENQDVVESSENMEFDEDENAFFDEEISPVALESAEIVESTESAENQDVVESTENMEFDEDENAFFDEEISPVALSGVDTLALYATTPTYQIYRPTYTYQNKTFIQYKNITVNGGVQSVPYYTAKMVTSDGTAVYSEPLWIVDSGETRVGYCFNANRYWPKSPTATKYEKYENVSSNTMSQLAGTGTRYNIKEDILRVIYNGYPENAAKIKETYGLTNMELRCVTQAAIWKYTDGLDRDKAFSELRLTTDYNASTGKVLNVYEIFTITENMKNAYDALVNVNTTVKVPSGYELDVYKDTTSNYFQNILSTKKTDVPDTTPISVSLEARKTLDNVDPTENQKFDFTLYDAEGTEIETVQNNKGTITFTTLSFDAAGTYEYYVREKTGTDTTVSYDDKLYCAKVLVENNGNQLSANVEYTLLTDYEGELSNLQVNKSVSKQEILFENTTKPTSPEKKEANPEIEIKAKKELDGAAPGNNSFHFILWKDQNKTQKISEAYNTEDGTIIFPDKVTEAGEYWIEEVNDAENHPGINFDPQNMKKVVVTLKQTTTIDETKTYVGGRGVVGNTGIENLHIVIDGVEYPGFCINEDKEAPNSADYNITTNPTSQEINNNTKAYTKDSQIAEKLRKLVYYYINPDNANEVTFTTKQGKTKTARLSKLRMQEFIWRITGSTTDGLRLDDWYVEPPLTSGETGYIATPYATNQEVLDAMLAQSNPPESFQLILATQGNHQPFVSGVLGQSSFETSYEGTASVPTFENTTKQKAPAKVVLTAEKYFNDKTPSAGQKFEFTLVNAEGETLQTVTNNGKQITFSELTFEEEGTYTYTIQEKASIDAHMISDATVYTVTVNVTLDSRTYQLNATVSKKVANKDVSGEMQFKNYSASDLSLKKTVKGNAGDYNKEFTFTISLNDKDGNKVNGSYQALVNGKDTTIVFSNGIATVKLKHDQEAIIKNIPYGATYEIVEAEANQDGYETSVKTQNEKGTIGTENVEVEFINNKDIIVETGINNNAAPYASALTFCLLGLTICFGLFKMKKQKQ